MSTPTPDYDTEALRAGDNRTVHPWESMKSYGSNRRTIAGRAEGVYVYDTDGRRLLDGPGGMWCVNIGHGSREMADAVAAQIVEMDYSSPWSLATAPAARLTERLTELAPGDLGNVFYTTGGSTAVDAAIRFAWFFNNVLGRPEKKHVISREKAYHGSTHLAASLCGKGRDKSFVDLETARVHFVAAPDPYRRPEGMSVEAFCDQLIAELEAKIAQLGPERVAAFVAEPILASSGVIVPPPGYHRRCLEVCRANDVLYVSDEVVTGFGRLGHVFASEPVFDIVPDVITCAKGLTSGYVPLGALLVSDAVLDRIRGERSRDAVLSVGFTYSGHPVACAAALKNLEIMERDGILEHVRELSPYFQSSLATLEEIPIVGNVRGAGLRACVECVIAKESRQPLTLDYEIGNRIDRHCQRLGLLVRPMINMCVMSPPLVITREQVDEMVDILRRGIVAAMEEVRAEGLWDG